jgi:putative transposase
MAFCASGFAAGFGPTGRCHKRGFLLKLARDRRQWVHWLFEPKKRYGLCILDYIVTSNHIHLLVEDTGSSETIGRSIQLMAGRTAQAFNQRKGRLKPTPLGSTKRCEPKIGK